MSRDVRDTGRGNGRHSSSIVHKGFIGQASSSGGLRDFLQTNDIAVRDVVLRSYADAKFNLFKLPVSVDDADKVMNPLIWGCGIKVQRWRKLTNTQNNGE